LAPCLSALAQSHKSNYFEIQVVDDQTDRGVPLVELETVNHMRFVTDSAGRVAFYEPGLMDQTIFFHVRSHGYEFQKDGFGFAGTRLKPVAGEKAVLRIKRLNIAERLYRVTGEGIYRDSVLLGEKTPLAEPLGSGQVAGQDSAQASLYRGKIYWFWGDTLRMKYPLGNFWASGATSELPEKGGLDPAIGINLRYFTDSEGFSKPMCRLGVKGGPIWVDGLLTVPDETGRERLVGHYLHVKSLGEVLDHGLAIFNDEKQEFERPATLDLKERWRFPHGHPNRRQEGGTDYFYFGNPFPVVRVKVELKRLTDPSSYEAWTCLEGNEAAESKIRRNADGKLLYAWKTGPKPIDAAEERKLIEAGLVKSDEARYQPVDVDTGKPVQMHFGTVRWNEYRRRWVMIAVQQGGTSFLGEVWYAEAAELTGPWRHAKKILTHTKYSFYNPVHHDFFDQAGGRFIYFEGTYATTFSGNTVGTPRYDYNQVMYRLDLADPQLKAAKVPGTLSRHKVPGTLAQRLRSFPKNRRG
jgi:hypothetical protein